MNFKTGKLYEVKRLYWLLYPTKETAEQTACAWCDETTADEVAGFWGCSLSCRVSYIRTETYVSVVSQEGSLVHIISPEGCGWIYAPAKYAWINECFEELTEANTRTRT